MKKYRIIKIFNIIIIVYVMSLSVGYALFKESLTIDGVASTVEYYEGTMLPTQAVVQTVTNDDTELSTYHIASNVPSWLTFESETWQDDTYTIEYVKNVNLIESNSESITTTFMVSFTNPTVLEYKEGKVFTEIVENESKIIQGATAEISSVEIAQGGVATVTFNVTAKPVVGSTTETVKATVSYVLQGKLRTFYLIVKYKV